MDRFVKNATPALIEQLSLSFNSTVHGLANISKMTLHPDFTQGAVILDSIDVGWLDIESSLMKDFKFDENYPLV